MWQLNQYSDWLQAEQQEFQSWHVSEQEELWIHATSHSNVNKWFIFSGKVADHSPSASVKMKDQ
jgi:hypothetical protein